MTPLFPSPPTSNLLAMAAGPAFQLYPASAQHHSLQATDVQPLVPGPGQEHRSPEFQFSLFSAALKSLLGLNHLGLSAGSTPSPQPLGLPPPLA